MQNDIMNGLNIGKDIQAKMNELSPATFFATISTILEGYCAEHGLNPVEQAGVLADMVYTINLVLGPIKP